MTPTYRSMGDHTETIEIDFDPKAISYEELLEVFWSNHNPFGAPWSRQYMSIILVHDEAQKRAADKSRAKKERARGSAVHTEIRPFKRFHMAEGYHQKYRLQNHPVLMREIRRVYPDGLEFVDSTAAARINGFLGGHGGKSGLERQLRSLGLTQTGQKALFDVLN